MKKLAIILILVIFLSLMLCACDEDDDSVGQDGEVWCAGDGTGVCEPRPEDGGSGSELLRLLMTWPESE